MKFGKLVAVAILGISLLGAMNGCSAVNMEIAKAVKDTKGADNPQKVEAFEKKFAKVLDNIKKKDDYKRIPLEGLEDFDWFVKESFLLWDKQQTREQYISNGEKKFPGYKETFAYLADEFSK